MKKSDLLNAVLRSHGMTLDEYVFYTGDDMGKMVNIDLEAENFDGTDIYLKCNFFLNPPEKRPIFLLITSYFLHTGDFPANQWS